MYLYVINKHQDILLAVIYNIYACYYGMFCAIDSKWAAIQFKTNITAFKTSINTTKVTPCNVYFYKRLSACYTLSMYVIDDARGTLLKVFFLISGLSIILQKNFVYLSRHTSRVRLMPHYILLLLETISQKPITIFIKLFLYQIPEKLQIKFPRHRLYYQSFVCYYFITIVLAS